jgi:hypothetical protein
MPRTRSNSRRRSARNVTGKLDDLYLHAETDTEIGNGKFARNTGRWRSFPRRPVRQSRRARCIPSTCRSRSAPTWDGTISASIHLRMTRRPGARSPRRRTVLGYGEVRRRASTRTSPTIPILSSRDGEWTRSTSVCHSAEIDAVISGLQIQGLHHDPIETLFVKGQGNVVDTGGIEQAEMTASAGTSPRGTSSA